MKKSCITTVALLCFMVCLILSPSVSFAQSTGDEHRDTTIITGIKPSVGNCSMYGENAWWLPDAYVINAACACTQIPDEPKANIIRQIIRERLEKTSQHIKDTAKKMKQDYLQHKITKRAYKRFVHSVLTPIFYADHVVAYRMAQCPATPSPYWTWKLASVKPFKNCRIIWFGARYCGGSCYGNWGKW